MGRTIENNINFILTEMAQADITIDIVKALKDDDVEGAKELYKGKPSGIKRTIDTFLKSARGTQFLKNEQYLQSLTDFGRKVSPNTYTSADAERHLNMSTKETQDAVKKKADAKAKKAETKKEGTVKTRNVKKTQMADDELRISGQKQVARWNDFLTRHGEQVTKTNADIKAAKMNLMTTAEKEAKTKIFARDIADLWQIKKNSNVGNDEVAKLFQDFVFNGKGDWNKVLKVIQKVKGDGADTLDTAHKVAAGLKAGLGKKQSKPELAKKVTELEDKKTARGEKMPLELKAEAEKFNTLKTTYNVITKQKNVAEESPGWKGLSETHKKDFADIAKNGDIAKVDAMKTRINKIYGPYNELMNQKHAAGKKEKLKNLATAAGDKEFTASIQTVLNNPNAIAKVIEMKATQYIGKEKKAFGDAVNDLHGKISVVEKAVQEVLFKKREEFRGWLKKAKDQRGIPQDKPLRPMAERGKGDKAENKEAEDFASKNSQHKKNVRGVMDARIKRFEAELSKNRTALSIKKKDPIKNKREIEEITKKVTELKTQISKLKANTQRI